VGANYRQFFDADRVDRLHAALRTCSRPESPCARCLARKDGTTRFVEESVGLRRDAKGRPLGFMGILTRLHRRKRAEQDLATAKDAAEAANRAKSEFLSPT
jgi:PAS domain S-box-containing protein